MFDQYSPQSVSMSNSYNYNVNAVSGTIHKSHPKSKITIESLDSKNRIFDAVKPVKCLAERGRGIFESDYHPVVVLQSMLTGNGVAIVEWVLVSDFNETVGGK